MCWLKSLPSLIRGADEQRVLRALGVFVDGFDLDAVAAVADRFGAVGGLSSCKVCATKAFACPCPSPCSVLSQLTAFASH